MTDHRKSSADPVLRATNRVFFIILGLVALFFITVFLNAFVSPVGLILLGIEVLVAVYWFIYTVNRRRMK